MPARQEWIHSNGTTSLPNPRAFLSGNLTDSEAVGLAREIFPGFFHTEDHIQGGKSHILFGNGTCGYVLVPRALFGDCYVDYAACVRESFCSGLNAEVGPLMRNGRGSGFSYNLAVEAVV